MIELNDVCCRFRKRKFGDKDFVAVAPVSLSFQDGGRYAIVGESGSGKTTLARMIAGLQFPSGGNILVDGHGIYKNRKTVRGHYKSVQLIQQNSASALDPKMTVGKSVEEPLRCFFHMEKQERKKKCLELFSLCNLPASY